MPHISLEHDRIRIHCFDLSKLVASIRLEFFWVDAKGGKSPTFKTSTFVFTNCTPFLDLNQIIAWFGPRDFLLIDTSGVWTPLLRKTAHLAVSIGLVAITTQVYRKLISTILRLSLLSGCLSCVHTYDSSPIRLQGGYELRTYEKLAMNNDWVLFHQTGFIPDVVRWLGRDWSASAFMNDARLQKISYWFIYG